MARQRKIAKNDISRYHCSDCKHSYDWHSKALDGHLILCRCRFYSDGKWCKLLNDWQCEKFDKRTKKDDDKTEQMG